MRILVISHNVFSNITNMGKTLSGYFKEFDSNDIAQLYFQPEKPSLNISQNYYRITDKDILKSIFTRKSGMIIKKSSYTNDQYSNDAYNSKIYQKAKKRTPIIYLLRNLLWKLGRWNTKKLKKWIDDFNPNIIFFASGDYAFSYIIALKLAKYRKIPLVVSCMDDYYFNNKNSKKILGNYVHKKFMNVVNKTMEYSSCIMPICEKMGHDYSKLFSKPYYVLHTSSMVTEPLNYTKKVKISYLGNLGYGRDKQLMYLGKILKNINNSCVPKFIDVYSTEKREEILKNMTINNGINFHGAIDKDEVLEVIGESMIVVHAESFDEKIKNQTKYSVSTKIADSLASGTCILAYGPSDIESIRYLQLNKAAYCIIDNADLEDKIKKIFIDDDLRKEIVYNALLLAKKNHNCSKNSISLKKYLEHLCHN